MMVPLDFQSSETEVNVQEIDVAAHVTFDASNAQTECPPTP